MLILYHKGKVINCSGCEEEVDKVTHAACKEHHHSEQIVLDNLCALLHIDPHSTIHLILSMNHGLQNQKQRIIDCVNIIKKEEETHRLEESNN